MFVAKQNNKLFTHSSSSVTNKASTPFIQPKLNVGKPGDKYEVEADRVADQVVAKQQNSTPSFFSPTVSPIQKQPEEDLQKQEEQVVIQEKPLAASITPLVQLQTEEEIQPKEEDELQQKEDEENLQTQSINGDDPGDTSSIESSLNHSKGGGTPLSGDTKSEMESGFGTDFNAVRVHTGSNAVQMSKDIGAQAFTHGNDIYFNEGKYNPTSDSGKHLLAHELTHTVQQGAAVQTKMIQKEDDSDPVTNAVDMLPSSGVLDEGPPKIITFESIPVPGFKLLNHRGTLYNAKKPLKRKNNYLRGSTNQRDGVWKENINKSEITSKLNELYLNHHRESPTPDTTHVFKANIRGRNPKPSYIGNIDTISRELTTPVWGKNKRYRSFDVDHIVELQLANWNEASWPNTLENMELLDSAKNSASGSTIKNQITGRLNQFRERHGEQYPGSDGYFKNNYTLAFTDATALAGGDRTINENQFWTKEQIEAGEHLNAIEVGNLADIGNEGEVRIFPTESGGLGKKFIWNGEASNVRSGEKTWFGNPFRIVAKQFNTTAEGVENTPTLGSLELNIPARDKTWQPWEENKVIPVHRYIGSKYAGYVTKQSVKSSLYGLRIQKASPVEIINLDLTPNGIEAYGQILPSIPIFAGSPIEFTISNGEVQVSKTFSMEEINVPPPFEITNSSLTIFASTRNGLGLSGQTDFAINNLGDGHIAATASTAGGFELAGAFNFDSELFDPAEINMEYKDNIWTIGGRIGIPEGKIRGVKNATITATYSENSFTASGEVELDIPGIQRGNMNVTYNDEGFSIGGDFQLKDDIPGIRGGSVSATIAKRDGDEGYNVMVSGTAQPDIPGINTSLTVTYDNGALTIEGSAAYGRGMLSGTVQVGATNKAIGEDGQPMGDPDDTMRVYGGGSLTLQLTPWLAATASVKFLPNGEIEVTGRIGLPSTVDVFPRKSFDRNLFNIPAIEIPLFAIPLGPRSVGLVARITGGLDFSAGFGPGELRDLYAEVTYNPEREDETTITGHGEFAIPADAGLTLRGDLGLGVSVGFASLTGGIELAGTLGLEGEAAAVVDVNWSPQTGLALDAEGRITVNPKFTFDVNAFARASLDLWLISLSKTWRHNLASFSWGPDIQFGIVFPVHYREGEPFDMSFDDLQVIYPDIDVVNMAKGLARDIKNDIF